LPLLSLRSGGNETAVVDGLALSRAFPDTMLNEDQLGTEWQSYPNLYVQDCNYRANLTPQQVEELGKYSVPIDSKYRFNLPS